MLKQIAIIQGHPDPGGKHFCHALAEAYRQGALQAGHEVKLIDVAQLDFPLLRTKEDHEHKQPPESIRQAQSTIQWANHLLLIYPIWAGSMPALLKAFFEQTLRPGFAYTQEENAFPKKLLAGRRARIIVTMGMPAPIYRWFYGAHSLKSLERNILKFCGIAPVKSTLIGLVEGMSKDRGERWLKKVQLLGAKGY